jgi:hypothetical protein
MPKMLFMLQIVKLLYGPPHKLASLLDSIDVSNNQVFSENLLWKNEEKPSSTILFGKY